MARGFENRINNLRCKASLTRYDKIETLLKPLIKLLESRIKVKHNHIFLPINQSKLIEIQA